jgi:hypothetical protein
MTSVSLYRFESDDIKVEIDARFENENLIVEGYDIGKRVEEYWGDSDYEYSLTVYASEAEKLYSLFGLQHQDKNGLLRAIAERFNTNTCFSEFGKFLDDHHIKAEGFSWI